MFGKIITVVVWVPGASDLLERELSETLNIALRLVHQDYRGSTCCASVFIFLRSHTMAAVKNISVLRDLS